jgi:hypothetical protein
MQLKNSTTYNNDKCTEELQLKTSGLWLIHTELQSKGYLPKMIQIIHSSHYITDIAYSIAASTEATNIFLIMDNDTLTVTK